MVTGVSGALHQSFPSEEEAKDIFAQEQRKGNVRIVGGSTMPPFQTHPEVARGSPLNSPVIEINGPTLSSPSSSPPTGITQVVPLSSSSALSPLSFRESDLEPDVSPVQSSRRVISIHASSSSPSSRRVTTSTVQLSTNDDAFPPITINLTSPVQHVHRTYGEHNVDALTSAVANLGLSPVPRVVDPRSPLTHPGLVPGSPP